MRCADPVLPSDWDSADLTIALAMTIAAFTAYLSGRVHQWSRHDLERRAAYCQGYDHASYALLAMAHGADGDGGGEP
jgi:hypothetical protein